MRLIPGAAATTAASGEPFAARAAACRGRLSQLLPNAARFFVCFACSCAITTGEEQVTTGQGGARPTLAIWAALVTILTIAGCAREEEPAPAPAPPPVAAPPPAPAATAAAPLRDSTDPLEHGRYLVETIAGCGNCHTPRQGPRAVRGRLRSPAPRWPRGALSFPERKPQLKPVY